MIVVCSIHAGVRRCHRQRKLLLDTSGMNSYMIREYVRICATYVHCRLFTLQEINFIHNYCDKSAKQVIVYLLRVDDYFTCL